MFIYICTMRLRDEQKELLVRTKALELLVAEGFNGFSMHKLAKAANVSPATLYIYFQNKEDVTYYSDGKIKEIKYLNYKNIYK